MPFSVKRRYINVFILFISLLMLDQAWSANIVPNQIKLPGTQPEDQIIPLDEVTVCANCHGNYDQNAEPLHNWRGSMMAHAGRDPIFWATLAVAEQGFDGAGDLCIRCHNAAGWLEGRSAPTDGSRLDEIKDRNGVQCDLCHRMTNPDDSEHLGEQADPFVANDLDDKEAGDTTAVEGNYGSGEYVVAFSNGTKYGPYNDAVAPPAAHNAMQSDFHRSPELCGTCHDVSNPVVGDLAHNNGAQVDLHYNGGFDSPLADKVAFKYRPYQYGVVERTYSEHKAGKLGTTLVSDYPNLPADLQAGAIKRAYEAATAATPDGNYSDGTLRYFTCQTCHMPPVRGKGANIGGRFNPPVRDDLPKHDLTGGNYWMPEAMQWLDARGRLKFGGLTAAEVTAMNAGADRARSNLEAAASLSVEGNTVKVVNLTSHKLISGYPEGRRMWLNIQWFDGNDNLIREDGAYGDLATDMDLDGDGAPDSVRTLLDLHDPNTRIYEVHGAITQQWASQLVELNAQKYADMPVTFDRVSGQVTSTMIELANKDPGSALHSFHFVLNNYVKSDTRIPGYGMDYNEAKRRNALPVPETQYGNPGPGGEYNYWDELALNVPAGAETATVRLLYQPTSWEYVQFLYLANEAPTPTLKDTGKDFLDAWYNTGMAEPHVMATTTWVNTGEVPVNSPPTAVFNASCTELSCSFDASASSDSDGSIVSYSWEFGDGSTATGISAAHTYGTDGTYLITLTVTDNGGASSSTSQSLTLTSATPSNAPPVADFTFACTELDCSFDASGSNDADGNIVSYVWDFGDGVTATGVNAAHLYAADGSYTVTLTVEDDAGALASVNQTVSVAAAVANQAPVADFSFVCTDLACDFNGGLSTDDGSITSYAWDFGDGNMGTGITPAHVYAADGSYTVTLTVTDDAGASTSVSQTVSVTATVTDQPPVADFSFACTDLSCNFDGSLSTDDGTITSYVWDFGDGATATGVTTAHTYAAANTYSVTLTVTDNAGTTGFITKPVTVNAPAAAPGPGPGPRWGR
jgi:PKD repeat protein